MFFMMYFARVMRGLAFINAERPAHWIGWVNPRRLDLASPYYCVLAQACGRSYGIATRDLGLPAGCEAKYGFTLEKKEGESKESLARRYRRLTRAWKIALWMQRKRYEMHRKIRSAWMRRRYGSATG